VKAIESAAEQRYHILQPATRQLAIEDALLGIENESQFRQKNNY